MTPAPSNSIPEFRQTPETVFQTRTARGFQGGVNKIVDVIRPSLGPFPRTVAIARATRTRSPEILDSGVFRSSNGGCSWRDLDFPMDLAQVCGKLLIL